MAAKRGPRHKSIASKKVGERVRRFREAADLTQAELARRAKTSASAVAMIEAGTRSPTVYALDNLARALGVSTARFFDTTPPPPTREDRIWTRLVRSLRPRPADELEAIERLVLALDKAAAAKARSARG